MADTSYTTLTYPNYPGYTVQYTGNTSPTVGGWTTLPSTAGVISATDFSDSLVLNGKNADIKVNGKSLCDSINKIEERLAIIQYNEEMEKEFDELRELGNQYRKLEEKFKSQKRVFDILKNTD